MGMRLEPLFNRIFVEPVTEQEVSTLILPMNFTGRRDRGKVVNAGNSKIFKVGDLVMFNIRAIRLIKFDGRELISLDESDIDLIMED
jgi:co-chaperonin GroES (HSP10)